jgi:hypothetical protein
MFPNSVPRGNAPTRAPDLASYDRIIVAFSGYEELSVMRSKLPHRARMSGGSRFYLGPATIALCIIPIPH